MEAACRWSKAKPTSPHPALTATSLAVLLKGLIGSHGQGLLLHQHITFHAPVLEAFVYGELLKHSTTAEGPDGHPNSPTQSAA